ncbi:MAG: DUF1259 domain-containing protein [Gemmatimonadaceae bacterium]
MKRGNIVEQKVTSLTAIALLCFASTAPIARAQIGGAPTGNWMAIEQILGRKGAANPGGVVRFGFPRSDLTVRLDGVDIKPALALGGWTAFVADGRKHVIVMGDLVLLEDEVAPVISALQAGGVEQTAVHNHLLREQPHVVYIHIHAHGDAESIARTIHAALAQTKTPLSAPAASAPAATPDLDTVTIARTLRASGKWNGGVYQVSVPRQERITADGIVVPPSMGVATAINFQPTGSGKAAITGDFVLREGEVNPVIRALRDNGIEVTALHTHMLMEQPKLFFMHFWANNDAVKLARGLASALERTASKR